MYESLTKYLTELTDDEFGTWFIDKENNGTPEHPIRMPYVNYSSTVEHFISDVYGFMDEHEEMGLNHYTDILKANGIEWGMNSMTTAVIENLDAKCILAMILGAIRAERFCDGALLGFLEEGSIARWLERLEALDKAQE